MKITLYAKRLQFVSLGTGKIHAQDTNTNYPVTMCGKNIPTSAEVRPPRELSDTALCGRCIASLRTYTGRYGLGGTLVGIEQEVPPAK